MSTRADSHDLDKLKRWHQALLADERVAFPVLALFLTSERDTAAHNLFRQFRASFERRKGRFQNLAIFGMHGVSGVVNKLAGACGLAEPKLPALVLFASPYEAAVYTVPLPGGQQDLGNASGILPRLEAAIDSGEDDPCLDDIPGARRLVVGGLFPVDITDVVGRVVRELETAPAS